MNHQILQMNEPVAIIRHGMNESLDLLGYLEARTLYYYKAFADDPDLKKVLQKRLFSEMYYYYGVLAATNKRNRLSHQLFVRSMKSNMLQFLRCSREHCWGLTCFKLSRILQHCLSSESFDRIRLIYRRLIRHRTR